MQHTKLPCNENKGGWGKMDIQAVLSVYHVLSWIYCCSSLVGLWELHPNHQLISSTEL